jgi:hypothetical protein
MKFHKKMGTHQLMKIETIFSLSIDPKLLRKLESQSYKQKSLRVLILERKELEIDESQGRC